MAPPTVQGKTTSAAATPQTSKQKNTKAPAEKTAPPSAVSRVPECPPGHDYQEVTTIQAGDGYRTITIDARRLLDAFGNNYASESRWHEFFCRETTPPTAEKTKAYKKDFKAYKKALSAYEKSESTGDQPFPPSLPQAKSKFYASAKGAKRLREVMDPTKQALDLNFLSEEDRKAIKTIQRTLPPTISLFEDQEKVKKEARMTELKERLPATFFVYKENKTLFEKEWGPIKATFQDRIRAAGSQKEKNRIIDERSTKKKELEIKYNILSGVSEEEIDKFYKLSNAPHNNSSKEEEPKKDFLQLGIQLHRNEIALLRYFLGDPIKPEDSHFRIIKNPYDTSYNLMTVGIHQDLHPKIKELVQRLTALKKANNATRATKDRLGDVIKSLNVWKLEAILKTSETKPLAFSKEMTAPLMKDVKDPSIFFDNVPKTYDPEKDESQNWLIRKFDDGMDYFSFPVGLYPDEIDHFRLMLDDQDNTVFHAGPYTNYDAKDKVGIYYIKDDLDTVQHFKNHLIGLRLHYENAENKEKYAATLKRLTLIETAVERALEEVRRRDFDTLFGTEGLPIGLAFTVAGVLLGGVPLTVKGAKALYKWWKDHGGPPSGGNGPGNPNIRVYQVPKDAQGLQKPATPVLPPSSARIHYTPKPIPGLTPQNIWNWDVAQMQADMSKGLCDPNKPVVTNADALAYYKEMDAKYNWVAPKTLDPRGELLASGIQLASALLLLAITTVDPVPGDEAVGAGAVSHAMAGLRTTAAAL